MEEHIFTYILGFVAHLVFSARLIIQWFKSEKEGKVISPIIFWQLSLLASFLLLVYGILRKDFAIILGQMLVYFVYIRNLQLQKAWKTLHVVIRGLALVMPIAVLTFLLKDHGYNLYEIIGNEKVSLGLMIWGSVGQVVFTFRFVYQWFYSEKRKESMLPMGFWIISLTGSMMIISYAVFRLDPNLILGQIGGLFIYSRNLLLSLNKKGLYDIFKKWWALRKQKSS